MKWVVGSIAVLVALIAGVGIGWVMRGRADEPLWRDHVAKLSTPPSPLPPALTTSSPPPALTAPPPPPVWTEDTESFAWPKTAASDVVAVDPTHYLLKRAYLVKIVTNNDWAMARWIPAVVDGGVVGMRVFGARADLAIAKLGLLNGDTVQTLNGLPITGPENALEAYTHKTDVHNAVLGLERRGAHVDLHYHVLD